MLKDAKVAISFALVALALMMEGMPDANADSKLPDPLKAGHVSNSDWVFGTHRYPAA